MNNTGQLAHQFSQTAAFRGIHAHPTTKPASGAAKAMQLAHDRTANLPIVQLQKNAILRATETRHEGAERQRHKMAFITSTARPVADQARIMFDLLEEALPRTTRRKSGCKDTLYSAYQVDGANGDRVVDVYVASKAAGRRGKPKAEGLSRT